MQNMPGKSHQHDKRAGQERRRGNSALRPGIERRSSQERRQTSVSEISYFEWASHFVKFQGRRLAEQSAGASDSPARTTDQR